MIEQGTATRSLRRLRFGLRGPARGRARARGRAGGGTRSTARRLRLLAGLVALALLAGGGWLWLRNSPLVSVKRVTITGVSGAEAPQIRAALTAAARGMTTLDIRVATLRAAVSSYPVVKGLRVSTSFPHDLHISVSEQLPVAAVTVGSRQVPVAADGTVLDEGQASATLPSLSLKAFPGGSTIQDPTARLELRVLAAAPARMLGRITGVSANYWHGVVVSVREGPQLYFGGGDRLAAKWQAVMAVLAAASTAGASYVDVTDPQRPAAGPANASSASGQSSTGASSSTGATSTPAPAAGAGSTTTGG